MKPKGMNVSFLPSTALILEMWREVVVYERRGIGSRESAEMHRNAPLVAEAEL